MTFLGSSMSSSMSGIWATERLESVRLHEKVCSKPARSKTGIQSQEVGTGTEYDGSISGGM